MGVWRVEPIDRNGRAGYAAVALCLALVPVHLALLRLTGIPFLVNCTFHELTGLPCMFCGLTRSVQALLRGDVAASLRWHALGPIIFICIAVFGAGCLLAALTGWCIHLTAAGKRAVRVASYAVAALALVYWALRLAGASFAAFPG